MNAIDLVHWTEERKADGDVDAAISDRKKNVGTVESEKMSVISGQKNAGGFFFVFLFVCLFACFFLFFVFCLFVFFFFGGGGGLPEKLRTCRSAKVKFKVCIPGKSMGRAQNSTREGTQYPNQPAPSGGGGGSHQTSLILIRLCWWGWNPI